MRTSPGQGQALLAQQTVVPQGRLFVPPSYYQTTGATEWTLNGANDSVAFSWIQECDMSLTSLSVHVAAVTTQGNVNLALHADSFGDPGTQIADLGSVDCGASPGWVRHSFSAQQLSRGTRYHVVCTGTAAKSYALSSKLPQPVLGSMLPDGTYSKRRLDGAETWTFIYPGSYSLERGSLNVILNSTADHVPPLVYGQYSGRFIHVPGSGLVSIPESGISLDCASLTAGSVSYVYAYMNGTALTLEAATTQPTVSNGIWVKSGDAGRVYLGMICPQSIQTGKQGPVDVPDRRLVANRHNQIIKNCGKWRIYTGGSSENLNAMPATWGAWMNGDDFRTQILIHGSSMRFFAHYGYFTNAMVQIAIGFATDSPAPESSANSWTAGCQMACHRAYGLYDIWPLRRNINGYTSGAVYYSYIDGTYGHASFMGEIYG
ncbi:MAG: choice-of-anchor R domain-containing protein [Thermodesulfobacteriota bacterium]